MKNIFFLFFFMIILLMVEFTSACAASVLFPVKEALPAFWEEARSDLKPLATPGRVTIVIIDYLQIKDLNVNMPVNFTRIINEGAIALMNVNTGGNVVPENTYATIGSGSHMVAFDSFSRGFAASEKLESGTAAEEYLQRTGRLPPLEVLVNLDIFKIGQMNKKFRYPVVPGALGMKIHEAGYKTAAFGNSDNADGLRRQILSIVMDDQGIVDTGSVNKNILHEENDFYGGFTTDYVSIIDRYAKLPSDVRFVAIDLGDFSRLQSARKDITEEMWNNWRYKFLQRSDQFLGDLINLMNKESDLLIVAVPTPGDDGFKKDKLSPVLMFGGGVSSGLLVSPTTRRPGIIMNIDIAPTVLNYLNIASTDVFIGRSVQVIPGAYTMNTLIGMHDVLASIYSARPPLQKGYVIYQLFLLAISLGFIFLRKRGKEWLKPFLLSVMTVPLVYLLIPLLPGIDINAMLVKLILSTAVIASGIALLHNRYGINPFMVISLLTLSLIAADIVVGSPLQKTSLLGYDPIVGARFYGLGNEYMGVLIGSVLIGTTALIPSLGKKTKIFITFSGVVYLIILYLIAAPQFGTNVGGTIVAASTFLAVFLLILGVRLTWPLVVAVALTVLLVAFAFIIHDAGRLPGYQSHIGRTAEYIMTSGLSGIMEIVSRKTEMNIKLIKYTIWSKVFLASLGVMILLFYQPVGIMKSVRVRYPYIYKGLVGVVFGSVIAFIFNDSGVVAAATIMIFGAPPFIYLVLEQLEGT